jgi:hypothetical protein
MFIIFFKILKRTSNEREELKKQKNDYLNVKIKRKPFMEYPERKYLDSEL